MRNLLILLYGLFCYAVFLPTFVYLVFFVGGFLAPITIDYGVSENPWWLALPINLILILSFGLQHSLMARPKFKESLTKVIPKSMERSSYVLIASLLWILIYWQWRPMPAVFWSLETPLVRYLLWSLFGTGFLTALTSTFLLNHFQLFGLQQVCRNWRGRGVAGPQFRRPLFYRIVRHPLITGILMFMWFTPHMTIGHFLFAFGMTSYVLIALEYEERDLVDSIEPEYRDYEGVVPKLVPFPRRKPRRHIGSFGA